MAREHSGIDRKHFLYRHRSFRFAPLHWSAILSSILLPAAITWLLVIRATQILQFHENLRRILLSWSGVPFRDVALAHEFQASTVLSPISGIANYHDRLWLPFVVCGIILALMAISYRKSPLTRGIILFGLVLLLASAVPAILHEQPQDSSFFVSFWLRCEFIIWIFLPWIISMLAGFIVPSFWARAFWTLATTVYGVIWSAGRLAFCCGLLYLAGPVLVLPLWFSFGILADLVALCAFYSFAVYHAGWVHESVTR